jgi:hypothetical protein
MVSENADNSIIDMEMFVQVRRLYVAFKPVIEDRQRPEENTWLKVADR